MMIIFCHGDQEGQGAERLHEVVERCRTDSGEHHEALFPDGNTTFIQCHYLLLSIGVSSQTHSHNCLLLRTFLFSLIETTRRIEWHHPSSSSVYCSSCPYFWRRRMEGRLGATFPIVKVGVHQGYHASGMPFLSLYQTMNVLHVHQARPGGHATSKLSASALPVTHGYHLLQSRV